MKAAGSGRKLGSGGAPPRTPPGPRDLSQLILSSKKRALCNKPVKAERRGELHRSALLTPSEVLYF